MKATQKFRRLVMLGLLLSAGLLVHGGVVEMTCSPMELTAVQGEKVMVRFILRNGSAHTLSQARNFFISFHAYDASGRLLAYDNPRFALPQPLKPGQSAGFAIPVYFNLAAGALIVEWELLREGEFWGRDKKWPPFFQSVRLRPLVSAAYRRAWLPTFFESGREWLDRGQYLLRQTLKNNEAWKNDAFFGFSAGTSYPQAWIRDTATLMFYARFFYPSGHLQSIIGHFLERQSPNGEIGDWVDTAGRSDKNTVESDQESSLVLAAFQLALDEPGWLQRTVNGMTVFSRLEKALEWLWRERFDPAVGLLWGGFTADWGDVERSYADDRATKLSDRSRRAFAIYTQALFLQAGQKLVAMAEWLQNEKCAQRWRRRLRIVSRSCRQRLYLPQQGYFLVHRLAAGEEDFFALEKGILAVGGNAEAIRAGLMNGDEIARFLGVLEKRRREYGLRSISFTLLPPYPRDFFPHPLLAPWSYQNGGEWDWIGGRLVTALYQNGFREKAGEYLREIMERGLRHHNLFEWSDRAGNGRGASFYAGAAGVLGEAILRGHFGLEEDFERYSLTVAGDPFKLTVSRNGDRFVVENSAQLSVEIAGLAKKEICLFTGGTAKKISITKKGKTVIKNR